MTKDALIRSLRTAGQTFIALFGMSLLGFLQDILEWANGNGATDFPDVMSLRFALTAAVVAAASGVVSWAVNVAEDLRGSDGLLGAKARPVGQPAAGGGYPEA